MFYTLKERLFLVKTYYKYENISAVQSAYRREFKTKQAPSHSVIKNIISRFEKTGSVTPTRTKAKETSKKRQEAKNQLETMVTEFPKLSIRKAASAVGVSPTLVYNILHDDLHLKAYKYNTWQKLEYHDYQKRVDFAQWFLALPKETKFSLVCSDEAYFYLTLPLNKQNNRIWSPDQPNEGIEVPLHDEKILVWCAISANKTFGVYYFDHAVNQDNYLEMLQTFFWPKILRTTNYKKINFQQDGATPHTANDVQKWLKEKFGKRFIDKTKWPPRSPGLNPCDYFLWDYLKDRVYNPLPKTLNDLKANLERKIKNISSNMLNSVFLEFEKRCNLVLTAEGGHIELKFKKFYIKR